jgi:hypothetical protein
MRFTFFIAMRFFPRILLLSATALFLGAGCVERVTGLAGSFSFGGTVSKDAAENATAIVLQPKSSLVIVPTVLGLGAGLLEDRRTVVTLDVWKPRDKAAFSWTRTEKKETAGSVEARAAFEEKKAGTPIGTAVGKGPEPVYEEVVKKGTIAIQNLRDSESNFLPSFWPEGVHDAGNNGVLFLSHAVYEKLRNTKKSPWHPGLFENPVGAVLDLSDSILAQVSGLKEKIQLRREAAELTADDDFSAFSLLVNGERKIVRVFRARDAAAEYVILDNEDAPLILKVTLNPISSGALDVLTPLGVLKAFAGYEISEVTL